MNPAHITPLDFDQTFATRSSLSIGEWARLVLEDAEDSRACLRASIEVLRATIERVRIMAEGYSPDPPACPS